MPQRRRIVLLFGLGIVLPSLLLGYLAFRGIQNDRALVEKDRLEGTRRAADEVVLAVDEKIRALETALAAAVAGLPGPPSRDLLRAPGRFTAEDPLIEAVFHFQAGAGIRFLRADLLYGSDGGRETGSSAADDLDRSAAFQAAQRLEFREKDYPGALASYQRALARSTGSPVAGLILNAVARVQKKAGLLRDAVATYARISREHAGVVIPGGMPLGPSAALEGAALSRELGDVSGCLRAALGVYRSLLRREWDLEKAEYGFFAERAKALIESCFADAPPGSDLGTLRAEFKTLGDKEISARARTERVLVFKDSAAGALESKLKTTGGAAPPAGPFSRMSLVIENTLYLVSIGGPPARTTDASNAAWGMILDPERLRENVLGPALRDHFSSAEVSWVVRSRDGAVLQASAQSAEGAATFRTNFASNFPDWTLEFHQTPPRLIKTFLLSRRGLYFFVFLLIAGILVFGLVLTLRFVSHELELARMKSDFVSTVSHEFKSPLTSIRQLAEMLQGGRVPSDERRQKYYDVLLEQSERLSLLTDNILSLARIEDGRAGFAFEPADIQALLTGVVSSFQERMRHEGFSIGLEIEGELPPLAVDRTSLAQAVTNLVDNAVKYSGDSRRVLVRASAQGAWLTIAVRDFGIGIKSGDLGQIFERFYRAGDELTRSVKGSGLGLTLVKEIVEAHHGEVRVESEPGKGSVFSIRVPLPPSKGDGP
jgi:signal transduction histidine kinase